MNVLFTGTGSIGTRHIKNLAHICKERDIPLMIDVLRRSDRVLPEEIRRLIRSEIRADAGADRDYDVLFVTDETKTHYEHIVTYRDRCRHMFIEKPALDSLDYNTERICPKEGSVYYVAAPIRFTEYFKELKKCADSGMVYAARVIFSSYMPDWQRGRDYRKSFRCFTERGGGVDIDSLHEIDYITALFGLPRRIHRAAGKYSDLEMEACDLAVYIFEYTDKIVELHLYYFGRANNRRAEFYMKDDVITVDFNKKTIEKQKAGETACFGPDQDFYEKEMSWFLDLIRSGGRMENINPVERALDTLRLAKGER